MKNLVKGITVGQVIGFLLGAKVTTSFDYTWEQNPYIYTIYK